MHPFISTHYQFMEEYAQKSHQMALADQSVRQYSHLLTGYDAKAAFGEALAYVETAAISNPQGLTEMTVKEIIATTMFGSMGLFLKNSYGLDIPALTNDVNYVMQRRNSYSGHGQQQMGMNQQYAPQPHPQAQTQPYGGGPWVAGNTVQQNYTPTPVAGFHTNQSSAPSAPSAGGLQLPTPTPTIMQPTDGPWSNEMKTDAHLQGLTNTAPIHPDVVESVKRPAKTKRAATKIKLVIEGGGENVYDAPHLVTASKPDLVDSVILADISHESPVMIITPPKPDMELLGSVVKIFETSNELPELLVSLTNLSRRKSTFGLLPMVNQMVTRYMEEVLRYVYDYTGMVIVDYFLDQEAVDNWLEQQGIMSEVHAAVNSLLYRQFSSLDLVDGEVNGRPICYIESTTIVKTLIIPWIISPNVGDNGYQINGISKSIFETLVDTAFSKLPHGEYSLKVWDASGMNYVFYRCGKDNDGAAPYVVKRTR